MLKIRITREVVGFMTLYEFTGRRGRTHKASLYRSYATYDGLTLPFSVSRDSSARVFGSPPKLRYDHKDECPPNAPGYPYQAVEVTHTGTKTFALRLSEVGSPHADILQGLGPVMRSHIMIHIGPGASFGCLMIGDGDVGHRKFANFVKRYLDSNRSDIIVDILPRHPDETS